MGVVLRLLGLPTCLTIAFWCGCTDAGGQATLDELLAGVQVENALTSVSSDLHAIRGWMTGLPGSFGTVNDAIRSHLAREVTAQRGEVATATRLSSLRREASHAWHPDDFVDTDDEEDGCEEVGYLNVHRPGGKPKPVPMPAVTRIEKPPPASGGDEYTVLHSPSETNPFDFTQPPPASAGATPRGSVSDDESVGRAASGGSVVDPPTGEGEYLMLTRPSTRQTPAQIIYEGDVMAQPLLETAESEI